MSDILNMEAGRELDRAEKVMGWRPEYAEVWQEIPNDIGSDYDYCLAICKAALLAIGGTP